MQGQKQGETMINDTHAYASSKKSASMAMSSRRSLALKCESLYSALARLEYTLLYSHVINSIQTAKSLLSSCQNTTYSTLMY